MGMLLGLILLPIALALLFLFGGLAYHMIHQSPMLYWTLIGLAVLWVILTPISLYNQRKRQREIKRWNEEQAAAKKLA